MTPQAQRHTLSDWLDLHELSPALCRRLLDAASAFEPPAIGQDPPDLAYDSIELDSAWQSTVDAMRLFLPEHRGIVDDTFEKTIRMLVSQKGRPRAALTIDHGVNTYPTILYSFQGKPSDVLIMAHEFAHAVQIRASEGRFVSPIMREICAFLGEWARLSFASTTDATQYRHFSRIWSADNRKHFGVGSARLTSALSQSDMAYSYSWNYPIARYLAISVQKQSLPDRIWRLFEGRTSVTRLLEELGLA